MLRKTILIFLAVMTWKAFQVFMWDNKTQKIYIYKTTNNKVCLLSTYGCFLITHSVSQAFHWNKETFFGGIHWSSISLFKWDYLVSIASHVCYKLKFNTLFQIRLFCECKSERSDRDHASCISILLTFLAF